MIAKDKKTKEWRGLLITGICVCRGRMVESHHVLDEL
jgi:hypothetical protein